MQCKVSIGNGKNRQPSSACSSCPIPDPLPLHLAGDVAPEPCTGIGCESLCFSKKSGLVGDTQVKVGELTFQNKKETLASENVTDKHTERIWWHKYQNLVS